MHAEGDSLNLCHDSAVYLKDSLHVLSLYFKDESSSGEEEKK